MSSHQQKTALIVLYNHNYEKNLDKIRKLYSSRFSQILQLMPFYYGNDSDVVSVFGNSFQFHSYIAQAQEAIMSLDADRILIIGDDLILNPNLEENNFSSKLNLGKDDAYLDGFVDVSKPICYRGTLEAHSFSTSPAGLDVASANRILPSYDEAFQILKSNNMMETTQLSKAKPFYQEWDKPIFGNFYRNYKIFKGRVWHFRNQLKYRFFPKKASYPVVFGYSDIVSIPKTRFLEFCNYLKVFASWNMFVELAIPTTLALMPNLNVVTLNQIQFKSGNVWYPCEGTHFSKIDNLIKNLEKECNYNLDILSDFFPNEYLYLHPVKLSQWN